jgi:hypothetical protein
MMSWRSVVCVVFAGLSPVWGQEVDLTEQVKPADCFAYTLEMKLQGELHIKKETGPSNLKLEASAKHQFTERVLSSADATVSRAVRHYDSVGVAINVGGNRSERSLRPSRKLIVAQRHQDQRMVYCPVGALQRGELEAVGDHFDTLMVAAVTPGKKVKQSDTWEIGKAIAGPLCNLEGVTEGGLTGKLLKVEVDQAHFSLAGKVAGVEHGAQVKCEVEATGVFDLKRKRLVKLKWQQRDQRDQGPVSPASETNVTVTLTRNAIDTPAELADVALISVPDGFTPPPALTFVEYRDVKGRYALFHPREWQLTAITPDHAVWRLVERGEFVAQATVTPWTKADKGKTLEPEAFKKAMNNTSGWRPEREIQAGKVDTADGKYVYRFSVLGQLDGVEVMQTFFLVANTEGEQVVVTFTLSPKNAEKLGAKDFSLVGSLEVPAAPEKK